MARGERPGLTAADQRQGAEHDHPERHWLGDGRVRDRVDPDVVRTRARRAAVFHEVPEGKTAAGCRAKPTHRDRVLLPRLGVATDLVSGVNVKQELREVADGRGGAANIGGTKPATLMRTCRRSGKMLASGERV